MMDKEIKRSILECLSEIESAQTELASPLPKEVENLTTKVWMAKENLADAVKILRDALWQNDLAEMRAACAREQQPHAGHTVNHV